MLRANRIAGTSRRTAGYAATALLLSSLVLITSCVTPPAPAPSVQLIRSSEPATVPVTPTPEELDLLTEVELRTSDIYRRLYRGVVNVHTLSISYSRFYLPYPTSGSGSGSIIDDGVVLTNHHVIAGAERIFVSLDDGVALPARVIGVDPENDLALLRFDPGERETVIIPIGTSSRLQIGQIVVALGNPFGLDRTLTTGVISGISRPIQLENGFLLRDLIQTDAAINPGNSGGPLLDLNGNLVGVNTLIVSPAGGSVGLGFAVSADTVSRIVPRLFSQGRIDRGWIEIVPVPIMPALAARANLEVSSGMLVSEVVPRGNAAAAGVNGGRLGSFVVLAGKTIHLGGDIILEIGGRKVRTYSEYFAALEETSPGDRIDLLLLRNGVRRTVSVELARRPSAFRW